jgi:hypothetical protein
MLLTRLACAYACFVFFCCGSGRYVTGTPRQGSRSGELSAPLQLGVQFAGQALRPSLDDAAAVLDPAADGNVILEEMKDMQVLRITANGRLFRCAATGSNWQ